MTDCLQAGYSITRQSVIVILFVFMVSSVFFPACSPDLAHLGPNQTIHHRNILFLFMVRRLVSACSPGLVYLGPISSAFQSGCPRTVAFKLDTLGPRYTKPELQAGKKPSSPEIQKEYSDNGLP